MFGAKRMRMRRDDLLRAGEIAHGAPAAIICCEVKCGESTGGAQFDFAPQTLVPAPRFVSVRSVLLDAMGEAEAAVVSINSVALLAAFGAAKEAAARATPQNDTQTATVEVTDNGFEPSSPKLKAVVPAKVTFVRKTDAACGREVVIKEYKINRKLPLNEPVTVEFTLRKGEFTFACGMDMIKGKLVVE
jgi:hypothetical protein